MKVIKPLQLGLLTRPFDYRRQSYLGVAVLAYVPLGEAEQLLPETSMWQDTVPLLGGDGVLDAAVPKSRGEFLVVGSAHAPAGESVALLRVSVSLADRGKTLAVSGDRYFEGDLISPAVPFQSMPLDWSRSFGGEGFADNPSGKGMTRVQSPSGEMRFPLPNIERPDQMMSRHFQRPQPAGFGPLGVDAPRRTARAGTYDQAWLKSDFPGLAHDIDWTYFNIASPDQWYESAFQGGEAYRLENLHPEKSLITGRLPSLSIRCLALRENAEQLEEVRSQLTTVWFFPELERAVLVYHASFVVAEDDARDISTLVVAADHPGQERALDHYAEVLAARSNTDAEPIDLLELLREEDLLPAGLAVSLLDQLEEQLQSTEPDPRRERLQRAHRQAVEEAREKAAEHGQELDPALLEDPFQGPEIPPLKELKSFFDKLEQERDETSDGLEAMKEEVRQQAIEAHGDKEQLQEVLRQIDEAETVTGPPQFTAQGQVDELNRQKAQLAEFGVDIDVSLIDQMLTDPAQRKLWQQAESGLLSAYRMSAHHQDAAPRSARAEQLREQLRAMLDAGESLRDRDFTGADLSEMDLSGADLRGILLESADLTRTCLSGARLEDAVLAHARLDHTLLDKACLDRANLGKSRWTKVDARGASLVGTTLAEARLREVDLSGATLSGMEMMLHAKFRSVRLDAIEGKELVFMEHDLRSVTFKSAKLPTTVFLNCDLTGTQFPGANLSESVFLTCTGVGSQLAGARLDGVKFVSGCDFSQADFSHCHAKGANLRGTRLIQADFSHSILDASDFSEVLAGSSRLAGSSAVAARWTRADLREADIRGVNLTDAALDKADLRGASLAGSNLFRADLALVHVDRATVFDSTLTRKMRTYPRKFPREA
ncbi:MAG: DUF2169 domain-containing protein [Wenzhouxiangella sp.]